MNPLLFMPSPRDIPEVKRQWPLLPYDKLIIKYKTQKEAYAEAREFFLKHEEYDHFVICADDLVILPEQLEALLDEVREVGYDQLDGICALDDNNPTENIHYCIQPQGCDLSGDSPKTNYGAWYMDGDPRGLAPILPENQYIEVGHSGAACRVLSRDLFKKLSFKGGNPTKDGWYDFGMSKEMKKLNMSIIVDTGVIMEHLRSRQPPINLDEGYTWLIQR